MFADIENRGLTETGPENAVPACKAWEQVQFNRYWLVVPHYGILKADAWPMWIEFLAFWQRHPRKIAKVKAWQAWLKTQPVLADVLKALEWQVECEQWIRDEGQAIPYPGTYLNQFRWEDERPDCGSRVHDISVYRVPAKRYTADGELIEGEEDVSE